MVSVVVLVDGCHGGSAKIGLVLLVVLIAVVILVVVSFLELTISARVVAIK